MAVPFTKLELLRLLKGARNGFYYGAKVRFMHSFVMFILFRKKGIKEELYKIISNALQHGTKLAKFVFMYKGVLLLLRKLFNSNSKLFNFLAGAICGFVVFRHKTPIDQQIGKQILHSICFCLSYNIICLISMSGNLGLLKFIILILY